MEEPYDSSDHLMSKGLTHIKRTKTHVKINQITSTEPQDKDGDSLTATNCSKLMVISTNTVYSASKNVQQNSLRTIIHLKPTYTLGVFLKRMQIVNQNPSIIINKIRSFPSNIFELISSSAKYELISNFTGSKYQLKSSGITSMVVRFDVGCGQRWRSFSVFSLKDMNDWKSLEGVEETQQLDELYEYGRNQQFISKWKTMEPAFCPQFGVFSIDFSRKSIIPCIQNALLCSPTAQKMLQLVKISDNEPLFQLTADNKIPYEQMIAIGVAALDFKICTE